MSSDLLGAHTASISLGLMIVFALEDSRAVGTTRRTLGPAADIVLGLLFVLIPFVISGDRDGDIPLALASDSFLAGITRISQAARRTPARPSSA
jgi:hypothetical protein